MRRNTDAGNERRRLARLVLLILLASLGINLLSAYIRHVEAGLDCADRPACYGQIGTRPEAIDGTTIARSALAPQALAKKAHRGMASVLVVLVLLLVHRSRARLRGGAAHLPLAMAGLLLALAVIGPASYLKTRPAIATANLLGGMALAALSWRLYLSLAGTARVSVSPVLARLARLGLAMLAVQLALGAWLSANFAGLGCTGSDACASGGIMDAFWYFRELALDANGRIITDRGSAAIRMAHGLGAALTAALLLSGSMLALRHDGPLRPAALVVLGLLLIQAALGLCALLYSLPLGIVLTHNTVAALLLLAVLRLNCLMDDGAPA
jgi:cytochrome c oxidase assembly protein subunit 15